MMKKLVSALLCLTMVCSVCMTIFAAGEIQPRQPGGAQYVQNVRIYAGVKSSSGAIDWWGYPVQIESYDQFQQSPYYIDVNPSLQANRPTSNGWWVEIDYYLGMPKPLKVYLRGEEIDTIYPSFGLNTYEVFIPFKYGDNTLKMSTQDISLRVHFRA